jgi:hypothetical protein
MKTKSLRNLAGSAVAAILFLVGATGLVVNAQDQPPSPPPDNSTPDDSAVLPSNIDPSSPLAQVVKLTQSGVSEDVITAYVNNSGSPFNLNSDQIIYLKDIGVPDTTVQAMIQRDQALQSQMASQPQPAPAPDTTVVATTDVAPPPTVVTVDYFYDTLSPYGSWVYVEGYGRCWRPTVVVGNVGWHPYGDHGHWVYTDDGWYWMSDYSWGWAPFHYGRWFRDTRFGWCWYPDTVWGPSWVTWRYSDDYCGWAPLPPRCEYREGVGFFYNGAAVSIGFDFGLDVGLFTFVHTRDFCDPHPWRHRVESGEVRQVFNHTTIINHFDVDSHNRTFINHGIDPQRITQVTHTPIRPIAIHEATGPTARGEQLGRDGRTLVVNRPHFTDNPRPSDRDASSHAGPSSPVVGSPYQLLHNGNQNNDLQTPRNYHPEPVGAENGSLGQPSHSGNQNGNNSQPPRTGQPVQTTPSPGNRYAPVTPVEPSAPNYNSTDNRRYPSPKAQQTEPQNPWANPGNPGGHVGTPVTPQVPANPPEANRYSTPAQPPQHNYGAPITPASPPARQPEANYYTPRVEQPAPAQPPQRDYVPPQNETPPAESRPNYSQPPAQDNQPRGGSAPSAPAGQSQNSGRGKNQNGQQ